MKASEAASLLLGHVRVNEDELCNGGVSGDVTQQFGWRALHVFFFFMGGITFIAGSTCYLYPTWDQSGLAAAILYIIGSVGFLGVDVLEWFTYASPTRLRVNISCSVVGSSWYVIGSAGFLPSVAAVYPNLGPWGFILGSFFIGSSQLWKVIRAACDGGDDGQLLTTFHPKNWIASLDAVTQVGVELDAGLGGWFFFFSTLMYQYGNSADPQYFNLIARLWIAGSVFFSMGSLFLWYRHFKMHL